MSAGGTSTVCCDVRRSAWCPPDGAGLLASPCSVFHWRAICCKLATNCSLSICAMIPSSSGCGVASAASMKCSMNPCCSMASSSNNLPRSCPRRSLVGECPSPWYRRHRSLYIGHAMLGPRPQGQYVVERVPVGAASTEMRPRLRHAVPLFPFSSPLRVGGAILVFIMYIVSTHSIFFPHFLACKITSSMSCTPRGSPDLPVVVINVSECVGKCPTSMTNSDVGRQNRYAAGVNTT